LKSAPAKELQDERGIIDPAKAWAAMMINEKPGGHGERSVAVGILDMAIWDAVAKAEGVPLWRLLANRYNNGKADETAWVYAAGGYYYPGEDEKSLQDEMRGYLDKGYSTVKMKVGGVPLKEDLKRIEAVLKILGGDGDKLCVDVNGRFDLDEAIAFGDAIAPYKLHWYEEPVDPLDYLLHAALATRYAGPLATGENLFSMQDARNLIRHGGLRPDRDWLQMDPALSYGLVEYLRTQEMLRQHGWSSRRCVPHGGHQFALNIATGLGLGGNESYPQVFAPFGGFADNVPVNDSRVKMPDVPGIGFEAKNDLYAVMKPMVA
jgi:L-alanine-DL-glutamate epimerase-like enolase superfamily enzyme